jgi:two-component system, LytTR family, sensor kinase
LHHIPFSFDFSSLKYFSRISNSIVVLAAVLALVPPAQLAVDWFEVTGYQQYADTPMESSARGSDWIEWEEMDGGITATYVFPHGPGAEAGIIEGDRFYLFDFQQYFDLDGLRNAVSGARPGETRDLAVVRGHEIIETRITLTRSPTFLYPRSPTLWTFALWGFTLGAFIHILGLFIAGPLVLHARRALFEFLLIAVSSLWIIGNLLRMMLVQMFGPPGTGTGYDYIFQALTLFAFVGWIGFPVLLLKKVHAARPSGNSVWSRMASFATYLAPGLLLVSVTLTTLFGHVGPVALEDLLVPILFYASCYVAAASAVVLLSFRQSRPDSDRAPGNWGRTGTVVVLTLSILVALVIIRVIPVLVSMSDTGAGWMIVGAQLLAVAPIALFSLGTLRHGKVDDVLTRGFIYVLILGSIFFAFVGGISLMESSLGRLGGSRIAVEGVYVVLLLILFDRFGRRLSLFASAFFASDRQKARKQLSSFQGRMTDFLDIKVLSQQTAHVLGTIFQARSVVVFLPSADNEDDWIMGTYHPEPPYLTERIFNALWPHFSMNPLIWARNPELNEHTLPDDIVRKLDDHGVALAVPIQAEGLARGMVLLGRKMRRSAVYNLDDLEQMRSVAGQLVLAVERLALIESERQLARESTNAHLVALRSQINPHFLFNALNTILSLIEENPEEAEAVVENLASIFRYTLHTGSEPFVTMEDEFSLVENYLMIERARFGDRLDVSCTLSPDTARHPVPAFTVQTLVENAVKHGLEKYRDRGKLTISCTPEKDGDAVIVVEDSGVGIPALFGTEPHSSGIASFFGLGLTNVASRLERLYGRDDLLRIESSPETGTRIDLRIPAKNRNDIFAPDSLNIIT